MRRLIYPNLMSVEMELVEFVERINGTRLREDATAIGTSRDGMIEAVFAFDTFSPTDCMIHVATRGTRRWASRRFLAHVFAYPFITCELRRLTSLVAFDNKPALRLNQKLGGVREGLLRQAGPNGEALVVFGMLREECRWIPQIASGQLRAEAV